MKLSMAGNGLHRYPEDWEETGSDWIDILEELSQVEERQRAKIARETLGVSLREIQQLALSAESDDAPAPEISSVKWGEFEEVVADYDIHKYLKGWSVKDDDDQPLPVNDKTIALLGSESYNYIVNTIKAHRGETVVGGADEKNSETSSSDTSVESGSQTTSQLKDTPQS